MNEKNFSQALRRGLGCAIIALKSSEDNAVYRKALMRCCLRDISYDWQSEGTKGYYLYDALMMSGEPDYYEKAIIKKFLSRCSNGLFYQLLAILYRFSQEGSEDAKAALRSKYNYFMSKKGRLVHNIFVDEGVQWDEVVFYLMHLEGFSAFKRYVEDVGRILLCSPENKKMYGEWFDIRARNVFGEKRIEVFFASNSIHSMSVHALVDMLKIRAYESHILQARRENGKITVSLLICVARKEANCENPRGRIIGVVRQFIRKASESEMKDLAHSALHEKQETVKALLLLAFSPRTVYSASFPLDISPLLKYAWSDNILLAEIAIECLKVFKDERIHELAIQLLKQKGLSSSSLALLIKNYRKADDVLLVGLILKISSIPHGIQQEVGEIYYRHRSANAFPILLHTYQRGNCAFCRHNIVRAMHHCGVLSYEILQECLYDSYDETRNFAKRLITHAYIKRNL